LSAGSKSSCSTRKKKFYDYDTYLERIKKIDQKLEKAEEVDIPSGYCFALFDSPQTCAKVVKAVK